MAEISLRGNPYNTCGNLPPIGTSAPDFKLTNKDLKDVSLVDFADKKKIISIVPSLDTPTCALSTRKFNQKIASMENVVVLTVSADLPFAQSRFCSTENIENVQALSTFRSNFADDYGVKIMDGPLAGVTARAVVVLDENNTVIHNQLVDEIANEPNYQAVFNVI